jgi:hypothetical protein
MGEWTQLNCSYLNHVAQGSHDKYNKVAGQGRFRQIANVNEPLGRRRRGRRRIGVGSKIRRQRQIRRLQRRCLPTTRLPHSALHTNRPVLPDLPVRPGGNSSAHQQAQSSQTGSSPSSF